MGVSIVKMFLFSILNAADKDFSFWENTLVY